MPALAQERIQAQNRIPGKGYRIHEEQIRILARYYHELYHVRRTPRPTAGTDGSQADGQNLSAIRRTNPLIRRRLGESVIVEEEPVMQLRGASSEEKTSRSPFFAVRCCRCGIAFPLADFLYTQKTGLCIDCWEALVL